MGPWSHTPREPLASAGWAWDHRGLVTIKRGGSTCSRCERSCATRRWPSASPRQPARWWMHRSRRPRPFLRNAIKLDDAQLAALRAGRGRHQAAAGDGEGGGSPSSERRRSGARRPPSCSASGTSRTSARSRRSPRSAASATRRASRTSRASRGREVPDLDALKVCKAGKCDVKIGRAQGLDRLSKEVNWSAPGRLRQGAKRSRQAADAGLRDVLPRGRHGRHGPHPGQAEPPTRCPPSSARCSRTPPTPSSTSPRSRSTSRPTPRESWPTPRTCSTGREGHVRAQARGHDLPRDTPHPGGEGARSRVSHQDPLRQPLLQRRAGAALRPFRPRTAPACTTWNLYRTRIDPPTGMLAGTLLGRVRNGVQQGVTENLKVAKTRIEAR